MYKKYNIYLGIKLYNESKKLKNNELMKIFIKTNSEVTQNNKYILKTYSSPFHNKCVWIMILKLFYNVLNLRGNKNMVIYILYVSSSEYWKIKTVGISQTIIVKLICLRRFRLKRRPKLATDDNNYYYRYSKCITENALNGKLMDAQKNFFLCHSSPTP